MRISHQFRHHPLRFMLYMEWGFLLIIFLTELLRLRFMGGAQFSLLNLISLVIFGVMGLYVPTQCQWHKVAYTGLEFFLITIMTLIGGVRIYPLLYIVLVLRNSFIFKRTGRFIITGLALIFFLISLAYRLRVMRIPRIFVPYGTPYIFISLIILVGVVMLFLQLLVDTVLAEHENRKKLALANDQLRRYALRVEDIATLQERNRIAREIHDSLGHSLTIFNLHLEAAIRLLPTDPDEAMSLLIEAKDVSAKTMTNVRQSVAALRSDPLQGKPLSEAIASLIEEFRRSSNINPDTTIHLSSPIPDDVKTAAYRILQEALTNICKYSEATAVTIHITTQDDLHIEIWDNGKGFNLEQNLAGFGIQGMRERALMLGGELTIITAPNQGCTVTAILPLPLH
ncbi:MAG: sensor histidine kinase [Elainellaceae cyanobacterium]